MKKNIFLYVILTLFSVTYAAPKNKKAIDPLEYKDQIIEALKGLKITPPKEKRTLLIFSVTNGYKHKSIPVGQLALQLMGEKTGAFETVISNDLANFEPENIQEFDAICFLNTTLEVFSPRKNVAKTLSLEEKKEWAAREARLKKSLMNFIQGGKGFIGFHAATDTFYQWPEYGEMIGGYFDGHPWNAGMDVSIRVEEGKKNHFSTTHLEGRELEFKEEIYQFKDPYNAENLEIVLRLDRHKNNFEKAKRKDKDYPISWFKKHGEGLVFYSSLGHNNHIYHNSEVLQHFLSGIQWALGDI